MKPDFPGHFTYLLLDFFCILFPLFFSFDKKVHFYTCWWRLFPAIIIGAACFLAWDEWFTRYHVWTFNPDYITGIFIGHLPVEEWLFFICVPFSCFFIYECLKAYFPNAELNSPVISFMLIGLFIMIGLPNYRRIYTFITFTGAGFILLLHYLLFNKKYLTHFYLMWFIHLIPLLIINGFLTGLPVVIYDDEQNLGIRIGTIPLEDFFYSMLLLLINLTAYEGIARLKKSKNG